MAGTGVTIYAVAARAGVSIASVSRVLRGTDAVSPEVRTKVLAAVDALHYVPRNAARSLAVRRSEAYGFVLGDITAPYYAELLIGFEVAAAADGRSVVLLVADQRDDPAAALRDLAGRVDGLVIGPSAVPDTLLSGLVEALPVVLIARDALPGTDTVAAENVDSATALTRHLLDHGRRRLQFVGDPTGSRDGRERHQGFLAAHVESGIEPLPTLVADQTEEAGRALARALLADPAGAGADGLVCANDELALAIVQELQAAGTRIPDDVAVVGWDDVMASRYIRPGLTTVAQPVRHLGRAAAALLTGRIHDAQLPTASLLLPTTLVIRSSCGCTSVRDAA